MDDRLRASLLWGVVGALAFLVLVQGYELIARVGLGLPAKLAVALAVGVVATLLTYFGERWLAARVADQR